MTTTQITMIRKQGLDRITLLVIDNNGVKSYWYGNKKYSRNQLLAIYQYSKEIGYKPFIKKY